MAAAGMAGGGESLGDGAAVDENNSCRFARWRQRTVSRLAVRAVTLGAWRGSAVPAAKQL